MPRFTATEMVGVQLTTEEAQKLLDALAQGKLGDPADADNVALQQKLTVMLQVATASEKRRSDERGRRT